MKIEGLTPIQVEIADHLWSLGTSDQCQAWLRTLSPAIYDEALIVMELMMLASVDEYIDDMTSYPDAEYLIKKVQNM
jgi:hypothetical protein